MVQKKLAKKDETVKKKSREDASKKGSSPEVSETPKENSNSIKNEKNVTQDNEDIVDPISEKKQNVVIMVLGVLGVALLFFAMYAVQQYDFSDLFSDTRHGVVGENQYNYNGFTFVRQNLLWNTVVVQRRSINGEIVSRDIMLTTYYSPRELEDIVVDRTAFNITNEELIVLSFRPNLGQTDTVAGVEVGKVVGTRNDFLGIPTQFAVFEPYDGTFPVISCESTNDTVIEFRYDGRNAIERDGNCIRLIAFQEEDLVRVATRYIFGLLGIMP
ncbi:MAG: hypothetical protein ACMXYK_02900 [Candidatus Woesearchaeota archaeon]